MPSLEPDYYLVAQIKYSLPVTESLAQTENIALAKESLIKPFSFSDSAHEGIMLGRNLFKIVAGNEPIKLEETQSYEAATLWIPISKADRDKLFELRKDILAEGAYAGAEEFKANADVSSTIIRYAIKSRHPEAISRAVTDFRFDSAIVKQSIRDCIAEMIDAYLKALSGDSKDRATAYCTSLVPINTRKELKAWLKENEQSRGTTDPELLELITIVKTWYSCVFSMEHRDLQDFYKSRKGETTWHFKNKPAASPSAAAKPIEAKTPAQSEMNTLIRNALLSRDRAVIQAALFRTDVDPGYFLDIATSFIDELMSNCKRKIKKESGRNNLDLTDLEHARAQGDHGISMWLKKYDIVTEGISPDSIRLDLIFIAKLPIILTELLHERNLKETDYPSDDSSIPVDGDDDEDSYEFVPEFRGGHDAPRSLQRTQRAGNLNKVLFPDSDEDSDTKRAVETVTGTGAGAGHRGKAYGWDGSVAAARHYHSPSDRLLGDGPFTALPPPPAARPTAKASSEVPALSSLAGGSARIFSPRTLTADTDRPLLTAYQLVEELFRRLNENKLSATKASLTDLFNETISLNYQSLDFKTDPLRKDIAALNRRVKSFLQGSIEPDMLNELDLFGEAEALRNTDTRSGCGL